MGVKRDEGGVSLAYSGGLLEHLEIAAPLLDRLGIKATFFLPPTTALLEVGRWLKIAEAGHELGLHTFYNDHINGTLDLWTLQMVQDELQAADELFEELFGFTPKSFMLPPGQNLCAKGDYAILASKRYPRVLHRENLLKTFLAADTTGADLIDFVEQALIKKVGAIIEFEGIGSGEIGCDALAHHELLDYLSSLPEGTVDTVDKIANTQ